MEITEETLQKIAHLARLHLDPEIIPDLKKDMEEILTWVAKLEELDTEGVAPLTHMSAEINVLRKDQVNGELPAERAFANAPRSENGHFLVPKVIE